MAGMGDVIAGAQLGTEQTKSAYQPIQHGLEFGMQYAQNQASLDIHKQQVKQQQDYLDVYKKDFNAKVGRQMMDDYNDFITLPKGSELKKTKGEQWAQTYQNAGLIDENTADQWIAAGKEEKMQMDWPQMYKGATGLEAKDPEGYQQAMEHARTVFGNKPTLDLFKNNSDKILMREANMARMDRIDTRQYTLSAQKDYNKVASSIRPFLDGSLRAQSIIEKVEKADNDPDKLAATKQIRTILANEDARLVTQKSNFGETTAGGMQLDAYANRAKDLYNQITPPGTKLNDAIRPEDLQQIKTLYKDLQSEYSQAHDRAKDTILGSANPTQAGVIKGGAKAFQMGYRKKLGKWDGSSPEFEESEVGGPKQQPVPKEEPKDAQPTATQLQMSQQLKTRLKNATSDTERNQIILKIKSKITPELRQKLGLP